MFLIRKLKNYVSEADRFWKKYDKEHTELTASQEQEIAKANRIAKQRDKAVNSDDKSKVWSEF